MWRRTDRQNGSYWSKVEIAQNSWQKMKFFWILFNIFLVYETFLFLLCHEQTHTHTHTRAKMSWGLSDLLFATEKKNYNLKSLLHAEDSDKVTQLIEKDFWGGKEKGIFGTARNIATARLASKLASVARFSSFDIRIWASIFALTLPSKPC